MEVAVETERVVGIAVAGVDNVAGGKLAASTLVARGYRRIAFLGGPESASSTTDRLKGLSQGLATHGLKPRAALFSTSYSHDAGQTLMRALLKKGGIDAVFCGDDILAIGALDACIEGKVRVPKDIGILGFNDIAMAGWPAYGLTTIRQPIAKIISAAVEMIAAMTEGVASAPPSRHFGCSLIERRSLKPV